MARMIPKGSDKQYGTCVECGKRIAAKKDGAPRHHTNGKSEWPGSPFAQVCGSRSFRPVNPYVVELLGRIHKRGCEKTPGMVWDWEGRNALPNDKTCDECLPDGLATAPARPGGDAK